MPLPALLALPTEVLSLVLAQLCLVRNIKGVKRTCRAFRDSVPAAEQAHRRVCYEGHTGAPAHSRPELWRLP